MANVAKITLKLQQYTDVLHNVFQKPKVKRFNFQDFIGRPIKVINQVVTINSTLIIIEVSGGLNIPNCRLSI